MAGHTRIPGLPRSAVPAIWPAARRKVRFIHTLGDDYRKAQPRNREAADEAAGHARFEKRVGFEPSRQWSTDPTAEFHNSPAVHQNQNEPAVEEAGRSTGKQRALSPP